MRHVSLRNKYAECFDNFSSEAFEQIYAFVVSVSGLLTGCACFLNNRTKLNVH